MVSGFPKIERLTSFAKRSLRLMADAKYRQQQAEINRDIKLTEEQVASWAAQNDGSMEHRGHFGIISLTNLPVHAKFHCLIAKTVQWQGYTPIIFTRSGNRVGQAYYCLFGLSDLMKWEEWVAQHGLTLSGLDEQAQKLLPKDLSVRTARGILFHGVHVGEHALSFTCRMRFEGRLNFDDEGTREMFIGYLKDAIQSVVVAEKFMDQVPLQKLLVRDAGYIPSGAIYEVALMRGVDCVVLEMGQRRSTWIFKRYSPDTRGQHYFSLSAPTWERVKKEPWTSAHEQELENEFAGRYLPDSTDDTRRLQSGKLVLPPDEVRARLNLDPHKKTAVIFSHVAWDAAFFFGDCLFDDLEDWLYQTVQYVSENCPDVNWVIKEHPFNVFKLRREGVAVSSEQRLLRPLMPLPPHVHFLPADTEINTRSLFPLVDCVLTVNGTVGMEFPCFGIPAVTAGTGRYNGYGFTIEPRTKAEYFETLCKLAHIERLPDAVRLLARKHFRALMIGKQISFADVAPMELKRIHEAQSDVHDNIHFTSRGLDEFRNAHSVNLLGEWLANSSEPDLIELRQGDA